ncbi:hypothetical protein D3C79_1032110 [compost metagenome]
MMVPSGLLALTLSSSVTPSAEALSMEPTTGVVSLMVSRPSGTALKSPPSGKRTAA